MLNRVLRVCDNIFEYMFMLPLASKFEKAYSMNEPFNARMTARSFMELRKHP